MSLVRAHVTLRNPADKSREPVEVEALVDTGAMHLCLPEHVVLQLGLSEIERREVVFADATKHLVPYVGPIEIRFENRLGFVGAIVVGDDVVLGTIPMLAVQPGRA